MIRKEEIEVYSDATNAAIMRHPNRKFPGVLVQGDSLHAMYRASDRVLAELDPESDIYYELLDLNDRLKGLVDHYKATLEAQGLPLPFYTGK